MGLVYHSYLFIHIYLVLQKIWALRAIPSELWVIPFCQRSTQMVWGWISLSSLLWAQPGLGKERETAASTQKQAFSYDQPGKAETSAHDTGWHCSLTCDLDSAKWDTHMGNTFKKSPLSRVTLPSVTPSKPAVTRLSGFHPD